MKKIATLTLLLMLTASAGVSASAEPKSSHKYIVHGMRLVDSLNKQSSTDLGTGVFDGERHSLLFGDGNRRRVSLVHEAQHESQILGLVSDSLSNTLIFEGFPDNTRLTIDGVIQSKTQDQLSGLDLALSPFDVHRISAEQVSPVPLENYAMWREAGLNPTELMNVSATVLVIQPLALAAQPTYTRFRYQTFIPQKLVAPTIKLTCPTLYSERYKQGYFLGENRSWDPFSTANKTLLDFRVDWNTLTLTNVIKSVATTQVIYVDPQGVETIGPSANAGTSGMNVSVTARSATQVQVHMTHDIANPLCALAEGIFYDIYATAFRSGSYTMAGSLVRVPNHEFYVRDSLSTSWTTIHRLAMTSFDDLAPPRIPSDVSNSGAIN